MKNKLLWIVQAILAILFVFAGITKLVADPVQLAADSHMPATFLHFVSICEILGAVGLIIPGVTGIQISLTPVAAACLVVIMIGAVVSTVMYQTAALAIFPAIVGLLLIVIVVGRRRIPPGSGAHHAVA
ncbi:MAG TPA: DoxX family protein [Vicinamibacterales bacterium]|nr:DoxX family protein [Vicinamibacterales bacterium]